MKEIVFILILLSLNSYAQDNYILHPSLSDTIRLNDKLDYSLFPTISSESFDFSVINFKDNNYYLKSFYTKKDSVSEVILTEVELIEAQQNIEKINLYYREKFKSEILDSTEKVAFDQTDLELSEDAQEEMMKKNRMESRFKIYDERLKEFEKGLTPQGLHIEFDL